MRRVFRAALYVPSRPLATAVVTELSRPLSVGMIMSANNESMYRYDPYISAGSMLANAIEEINVVLIVITLLPDSQIPPRMRYLTSVFRYASVRFKIERTRTFVMVL